MSKTAYETTLRITGLSLAIVLLFVSGIISPVTQQMTLDTTDYLANAIGMSAGVEPTELNQITAALTEKETALNAREKSLSEREIAVNVGRGNGQDLPDVSTFILSSILFLILVLIVLNYVLDYLRYRKEYQDLPAS